MPDIKKKILVVDDDSGMTETLSDIFIEMGHDVTVANSGYEAVRLVKERHFDFALIDIKMPGMNGVDTFKEIKKIEPSIKVVMMTAFALDELIDDARRLGALDVLSKPLQMDKLDSFLRMA